MTPFWAPTIAYQGSENDGHELKQPFPKQLPARVGDQIPNGAEEERERDVGGVGERRGHLRDEEVARDTAAEAAEQRH